MPAPLSQRRTATLSRRACHPGLVEITRDLLTWPKRRTVTALGGRQELAVIEPGRLVLWHDEDHVTVYDDPDELRALACAVYAAMLDFDQARDDLRGRGRGRAHLKRARARAARQEIPR